MEVALRASLLAWLASDTVLAASLNGFTEEVPLRSALPRIGITASASTDWSTKTEIGYETLITLELHLRGDAADSGLALVSAVRARIVALPRAQSGFALSSIQFVRSRAQQLPDNNRAVLLEYRFRGFAA